MNQSKIPKMIKKIITMEFLDDIFLTHGNIFCIAGFKLDEFLYNRDNVLDWVYPDWIEEYECAFVDSSSAKRDKAHRILLRKLVHSRSPDDVHCGVTILQDLLLRARTHKEKRKALLLLAIGYYRIGNFSRSMDYVARCGKIEPKWRKLMVVADLLLSRITEERQRMLILVPAMAIGLATGLLGSTTLLLDPTWVMEALTLKFLTYKGVKKVVTGSLPDNSNPLQMHEEMYLLAHRYFIRGHFEDMPICNYLIDRCLEIAPEWKPAMTLKRRMKYATMKAYISEIMFEGIPYAIGGIMGVSIISEQQNNAEVQRISGSS